VSLSIRRMPNGGTLMCYVTLLPEMTRMLNGGTLMCYVTLLPEMSSRVNSHAMSLLHCSPDLHFLLRQTSPVGLS
jgi:hypothetical protein